MTDAHPPSSDTAAGARFFNACARDSYRVDPDTGKIARDKLGRPIIDQKGMVSDAQADRIQRGCKQFNFITGGIESGLSRMAWCVATRSQHPVHLGCAWGGNVAFVSATNETLEPIKQQILRDLEPLFVRRPTGNRIELQNADQGGDGEIDTRSGGMLHFTSLERGRLILSERVGMIVIDDAHKVPGFHDIWVNDILPMAKKWGARVFVFGRGVPAESGLGRLCLYYANHKEGCHRTIPTEANPAISQEMLVDKREVMDSASYARLFGGEIFEGSIEFTGAQLVIAEDETFIQWCDRLSADGLKVDGLPFRLDDRPTMRWIYEQVPSTVEEAFGQKLIIMKCSQVGFTVMEMLAMIYMALKFAPAKVGMFLPQQTLATVKSSQRFVPIVRTIPDAHKLMIENPSGTKGGEGNVLTRNMGDSVFYFLWTSGKATTESLPMDILSFDEVQEMALADMEKTQERLSASRIRYTLMGSTANWPDQDIHFFYKKGQCWRFWTLCEECGTHQVLDDHFPACIRLRQGVDVVKGEEVERLDYRYVCHHCDAVIPDSQHGEWRADNPEATTKSVHYPQFLSPTITPRDLIEAYHNADDMKNFYNRKLGKPYTDPSQVPVTMEALNACARLGMELGVQWEKSGEQYFMGLDQGGLFNVAIIAKRLPSGHMAVVHVEEIYSDDPFDRCSELMHEFKIAVCVVESLPNYNDAKRFAGRHKGRVFLASYSQMQDGMMRWGDAVPSSQERKTDEEDRDRYTVSLDQYKCMQVATSRITKQICVFPDPHGLVQTLKVKERSTEEVPMAILHDRVFLHLTRVALVAEMDEEERKFKRRVVKVGIDPHFAYAFMLLNVAWARSHGTTMFLNPDAVEPRALAPSAAAVREALPGLPESVIGMINAPEGSCGRCTAFVEGRCVERNLIVKEADPGCAMFLPVE